MERYTAFRSKSLVFLLPLALVLAQETEGQRLPDVERLLEANRIVRSEEGYAEMVEVLLRLAERPLDVNRAGFDSLKLLFLLSDSQIDQLVRTRKKMGGFVHLDELLWVPGIGKRDLENIRPFISLGGMEVGEKLEVVRKRGRHEVVVRGRRYWPRQEGYRKYLPEDAASEEEYRRKRANRFHGPPWATLVRYRLKAGDRLHFGVTMENDAGEGYFSRHQRAGFDFVSAHLRVRTPYVLKEVLLGDYKLQWGQGLVAWSGFSSGKSDVAVGNEKAGKGIQPYTSTDENAFLRGVALKFGLAQGLGAECFFSWKDTDGRLVEKDTLEGEDVMTASLYDSGYHRNDLECGKKDVLEERTAGMSVVWNTSRMRLGVNLLYYDFDPPLERGDRLYRKYADEGKGRWLGSVDYRTGWKGFYLYGETAVAGNGALATVNGVRTGWDWGAGNLVYRRYDRRYVSHYAGGFGEYANTSNEEGIYLGLDLSPLREMKLNLYTDLFRSMAPRYRQRIPDWGWEVLASLEYSHGGWTHLMRFRHEEKPEDVGDIGIGVRVRNEWRYQCNWAVYGGLELRTRLAVSHYAKHEDRDLGYMVYQDVIWEHPGKHFKLQARLAWFDTDSYFSRIYTYENNVLYGYSFPAFMGRGWRTYANLRWKPVEKLTCYLKTGWSRYPGREGKGSGVTRVEGRDDWELTLQVRLTF